MLLQGFKKRHKYVVTQSVKSKPAVADFWRLVWELRSNCIIMLTKVFDFMRVSYWSKVRIKRREHVFLQVMCLQYWPVSKFQYGDIEVETLQTRTYCYFVIRTLRIAKKGESPRQVGGGILSRHPIAYALQVTHFHFTEWELDSFPYISAFLELRRRVRKYLRDNPPEGPIVVRC